MTVLFIDSFTIYNSSLYFLLTEIFTDGQDEGGSIKDIYELTKL